METVVQTRGQATSPGLVLLSKPLPQSKPPYPIDKMEKGVGVLSALTYQNTTNHEGLSVWNYCKVLFIHHLPHAQ